MKKILIYVLAIVMFVGIVIYGNAELERRADYADLLDMLEESGAEYCDGKWILEEHFAHVNCITTFDENTHRGTIKAWGHLSNLGIEGYGPLTGKQLCLCTYTADGLNNFRIDGIFAI